MGTKREEFMKNFHALSGTTTGDKRQNLYAVLHVASQEDIDLSSLNARNEEEEQLKVDILIYFKNFNGLLGVLKMGNPFLIYKILKCNWFVKNISKHTTGIELVTQIFPHVSLNIKEKLLTRLGYLIKSPDTADEYLKAVEQAYGLYLAQRLLPACSIELILSCIDKSKLEITPRQLLFIFQTHPQHIEIIFNKLNSRNSRVDIKYKYRSVLDFLARNNASSFVKLHEKYNTAVKLGREGTRRFITKTKIHVLANPNKFDRILKLKYVGRCLDEDDFRIFYQRVFPKSIDRLQRYMVMLKDLTRRFRTNPAERLQLLLSTFRKFYDVELWEYSNLISVELLEMMSPGERERWMEARPKPDSIEDEAWISLMTPDKSIPMLKTKISLTSNVKRRARLINALVDTCKVNGNNEDAFVEVCKYFWATHRNDNHTVLNSFFYNVNSSWKLWKFNDRQWEHLLKCTQMQFDGACYFYRVIHEEYVYHRVRKGLSVTEQLGQWAREHHGLYNGFRKLPRSKQKEFLEEFSSLVGSHPNYSKEDELWSYMLNISEWNKNHPKAPVSFFINTEATRLMLDSFESDQSSDYENVAVMCVKMEFERAQKDNIPALLLKTKMDEYYGSVFIEWLSRNKPRIFCENLDVIVEFLLGVESYNYRRYRYSSVRRRIAEKCFQILNTGECKKKRTRRNLLILLSYTARPEDFLELMKETPDEVALTCLANLTPTAEVVEATLKYCQGDTLRYVLKSLYNIAAHLPETSIIPMVKTLSTRAVSARKHALFLSFRALHNGESRSTLELFLRTETNPTIRKAMFRVVFGNFLKNPNDFLWEAAKANLLEVKIDNSEACLHLATKYNRIPGSYLVEYVLFSWEVLKKLPLSNEMAVESKRRILLAAKPDIIPELPGAFCRDVLGYLGKAGSKFQETLYSFVAKCVIYGTDEALMGSVLERLEGFVVNEHGIDKKSAYSFVDALCSEFLIEERNLTAKKPVLNKFLSLWVGFFKPAHATLDEQIHMRLTLIYLKAQAENLAIKDIGLEIAAFCDELQTRRLLFSDVFNTSVEEFLYYIFRLDPEGDCVENRLILMEAILHYGQSDGCMVLVVSLLPNHVGNEIFKVKCGRIIEKIMASGGRDVQMRMIHYLNVRAWG